MISMEVHAEPTKAALQKLAAALNDRRNENRKIAAQFTSFVDRNFQREGALQPVPWAPLRPSTIAAKRRAGRSLKPLIRTGFMRASFLAFSDNDGAGIGNNAPYSEYHEQGTDKLPARKMLPPLEYAQQVVTQVYGLKLRNDREKAGL